MVRKFKKIIAGAFVFGFLFLDFSAKAEKFYRTPELESKIAISVGKSGVVKEKSAKERSKRKGRRGAGDKVCEDRLQLLYKIFSNADLCWSESMLRAGLENAINRRWKKIEEQSAAIGLFLAKRVAYAGLCEIRIDLLKKISEREIFLPADVAEYVRSGYVPPDSDEAMALEEVALRLHDRGIWKPIIDELIYAYESIRSGYGEVE